MLSLLCIVLLLFSVPYAFSAEGELDEEFQTVTCGSAVKLFHTRSGFRLHSHQVTYGSGSGQQSVTCYPTGNDPNSYFVVKGAFGETCQRGKPIACDSIIRLQHTTTKSHLHSHEHRSPISGNQEVSAYDKTDTGDNWILECVDKSSKKSGFWNRESKIRLKHVDTSKYLSSSTAHVFRNPIPGQLEVCAVKSATEDTIWEAREGLYFAQVS